MTTSQKKAAALRRQIKELNKLAEIQHARDRGMEAVFNICRQYGLTRSDLNIVAGKLAPMRITRKMRLMRMNKAMSEPKTVTNNLNGEAKNDKE